MIALSGMYNQIIACQQLTDGVSVHYEMPKSGHIHKSMLLRGVKFPKPALNQSDIEATKTRAAGRGGRGGFGGNNYGGASHRGNGRDNRGRESYNRGSSGGPQRPPQNAYGHQNMNQAAYGQQWMPPPPGLPFNGLPPPPPPGFGNYGSQFQQPPPPGTNGMPPRGGYGSYRGR